MYVLRVALLFFLLFNCVSCKKPRVIKSVVGTKCVDRGRDGVCRALHLCPSALNMIKEENRKPKSCGHEGNTFIVCCLPSVVVTGQLRSIFEDTLDGVIKSPNMTCRYDGTMPLMCCKTEDDFVQPSEPAGCPRIHKPELNLENLTRNDKLLANFLWAKCLSYQRFFKKCVNMGDSLTEFTREDTCGMAPANATEQRILNGRQARPRELPHMAVIGVRSKVPGDVNIIWVGGGALVSESFILTAAHILYENQHGRVRFAMLGSLNKTKAEDAGVLVNIKRVIPHKMYSKGSAKTYDIALLELYERVTFNEFIRPLCLPMPGREVDTDYIIAGWGEQTALGEAATVLMTANVKENKGHCVKMPGFDEETMICASGRDKLPQDTCKGDSGGPLMATFKNIPCSYSVEGVVAYGKDCGGNMGAYTNVSYFLEWVVRGVWGEEWEDYKNIPE